MTDFNVSHYTTYEKDIIYTGFLIAVTLKKYGDGAGGEKERLELKIELAVDLFVS